jgi:glycosyltransferase involved in cell wall biosynthesis
LRVVLAARKAMLCARSRSAAAYVKNVVVRNHPLSYRSIRGACPRKKTEVLGLLRVRNEHLILKDTLDHLSTHVDGIVVFDDASTDDSVEIARGHPAVLKVLVNKRWRKDREWEETSSRSLLYRTARQYDPSWFFYTDADERFEGSIRQYLLEQCADSVSAIKIALFDAYITEDDASDYASGQLYGFRRHFGPEQRNITMLWRAGTKVVFNLPDQREPLGIDPARIEVRFYCQHYGKAISIGHWEDTCDYYMEHFPKYGDKWRQRKGMAVHTLSDFGTPLYSWEEVKKAGVIIHQ